MLGHFSRVRRTLPAITLFTALSGLLSPSVLAQKQLPFGMLRSDTFGAGWTADGLANLEIGRFIGRAIDYRFLSDHTGTFSGLELYFVFRTICDGCYADGDGGIIQIQIRTDDGSPAHLPSNTVLGSTILQNPFLQWNRLVGFSPSVSLKAGSLYHIVFTNLSSDPVHNYVSINDIYTSVSGSNLQPATTDTNLAVLLKNQGAPWQLNTHHVPIFSVYFDDGFRQGQGYIDVKHNAMQVSGTAQVAEVFTVKDDNHTVSSLTVRLDPLSSTGNIQVVLANAVGQPLETGVFNFSGATQYSYAWMSYSFPPITLTLGSTYYILLSAQNGGQFQVSPMEQGAYYGFLTETFFTSECEVPNGSIWVGCLGQTNLDLPFYFR